MYLLQERKRQLFCCELSYKGECVVVAVRHAMENAVSALFRRLMNLYLVAL